MTMHQAVQHLLWWQTVVPAQKVKGISPNLLREAIESLGTVEHLEAGVLVPILMLLRPRAMAHSIPIQPYVVPHHIPDPYTLTPLLNGTLVGVDAGHRLNARLGRS